MHTLYILPWIFKGCVDSTAVSLPSDTDLIIFNMSEIQKATTAFFTPDQDDMEMSYKADPKACGLHVACI